MAAAALDGEPSGGPKAWDSGTQEVLDRVVVRVDVADEAAQAAVAQRYGADRVLPGGAGAAAARAEAAGARGRRPPGAESGRRRPKGHPGSARRCLLRPGRRSGGHRPGLRPRRTARWEAHELVHLARSLEGHPIPAEGSTFEEAQHRRRVG